MKPAEEVLGAVGFSVLSVRPGDTCVTMGVSDLPVVAPSIYLSLMESACVAALMEYLDSGETTFLTHSSLEIVGSAAAGVEIRANARVINIEGRELTFECRDHKLGGVLAARISVNGVPAIGPFGIGNGWLLVIIHIERHSCFKIAELVQGPRFAPLFHVAAHAYDGKKCQG